jgi:hypothetical protein
MLTVKVYSRELQEAVSKNGKAYAKQVAAIEVPNNAPIRFKMIRPSGQPLEPGEYGLSPESFGANEYGDLTVRPILVPLAGAKAPATGKAAG